MHEEAATASITFKSRWLLPQDLTLTTDCKMNVQQQQQPQQQQPINIIFNGLSQSVHNVPNRSNWTQEIVLLGQILSCVIVAQIFGSGIADLFYLFVIANSVILIGLLFWRTRCCSAASCCGDGNSTEKNVILPAQNWVPEITLIGFVISSLIAANIGRESTSFYVFALLNGIMCVALFLWRTRCCTGNNEPTVALPSTLTQSPVNSPVQMLYSNNSQAATCVPQPVVPAPLCDPISQPTSGNAFVAVDLKPPPYNPTYPV